MEIRVAYIVRAELCAKPSFIHSSFAFIGLDHMKFHLEQYMFKKLPLTFVLISISLPYYLFLAPFFTISS